MLELKTGVEQISKYDLYEMLEHGEPIEIVNVLSPDFYYLGIIKGSKKIPFDELEQHLDELNRSHEIITYCAHNGCVSSRKVAQKLIDYGFKARTYEGGIKEWKESGFPLE